ncbi:UMP kinase [Candidatus Pacearchaeota archaeon]|nr:UMP kinase [Candidatus Pacearchaeota archaeon]
MKEVIVISVGGSLIVPDKIDINFLKKFKALIIKQLRKGKKFIIICGGGKTARRYQEAAKNISQLSSEDVDWLGIHGTRINAHLMRAIFRDYAHAKIIKDPNEKVDFKEKILIAAGWKPGFSTDYDAVLLAKNFHVKKVANLTNIDYVYNKDPRKFKNAVALKEISWKVFRRLIPKKWDPGLNTPFDPVASGEAEKLGLEVVIMNGSDLKNFENYLEGKEFRGTKIY